MTRNDETRPRPVPARALFLSLAALAVPVAGVLLLPEIQQESAALLWLVPLIPAFLLAYHRGWTGVATAFAVGMATLSLTQVVVNWLERPVPEILPGVVAAYAGIALCIGWLAERLHLERRQVREMAFTDPLTGLPNRRHARAVLESEFAAARRGRPVSVILFDIDDFKGYNDAFGHAAGDDALGNFARILRENTRKMNLAARYGGEEFLVVMSGSDAEGGRVFAERVRRVLRATTVTVGELSVSAGVASHHPSMESPDELLAAADDALYQAKREGRDTVRIFRTDWRDEGEPWSASRSGDAVVDPDSGGGPEAPGEPGTPAPAAAGHRMTGFGEGRSVLMVEGDPAIRELLAGYLEREGFDVTTAGDAASAVRLLGSEFDVALAAVGLTGESGLDIVRTISSRWPATQIVFLSEVQDSEVVARALAAGADRYLVKPFRMPELRGHLADALARRDRIERDRARRPPAGTDPGERDEAARRAVGDGLRTVATSIGLRAPHFPGHPARVGLYASALAETVDPEGLRLPGDSIRLAGELHDLGMAAVPADVLEKPGRLAPEEIRRVREHPRTGRRMLRGILDDERVEEAVAWHHEAWDGSGYPDALAGEAIPLSARVVAIAEVLDALTSARPHRPAREWGEAISVIEEGFGTVFDPGLADPFRDSLSELERIHSRRWNGSAPASGEPRRAGGPEGRNGGRRANGGSEGS